MVNGQNAEIYLFGNYRKCFLFVWREILLLLQLLLQSTTKSWTNHCVSWITNTYIDCICCNFELKIYVTTTCDHRGRCYAKVRESSWTGMMLLQIIFYSRKLNSFLCLPYNLSGRRTPVYFEQHDCLQWCFPEACLLHLFSADFPSPSPFPSGAPTNQRSFDGEEMQGRGTRDYEWNSRSFGYSLCFLRRHNGNLGIFHWIIEKRWWGMWLHT